MEVNYMPVNESAIQAEIEAQSKVHSFKETLATIRLKLNSAIERKKALGASIREMLSAREDLIEMFRAEIKAKWPEYAGLSVKEILARITTAHPIYELWRPFHKDIQGMNGKIVSSLSQYKSLVKQVEGFEAEQYQVVDAYAAYQSQAPVPVPSVEAIENEVIDPLPSNIEEDVAVIEQVTALDLLDESTQDALLMQQAELQVDSEMEMQTMMKSTAVQGGEDQKRKYLMIAGAVALAYIFFGGKK